MWNGKYVGIETVLERVYRDYGFTDTLDWIDAIEWAGSCLDLMGVNLGYEEKVAGADNNSPAITITNYRGELPCDLKSVIQVREYTGKLPMRATTDTFHMTNKSSLREPNFGQNSDYTYKLTGNYIFTSFEVGQVEMSYYAVPTDDYGRPLVPDDEKVIRCVQDYIADKLAFKAYLRGEMDERKYRTIEEKLLWSMPSATTRMRTPTIDEMESIKNSWVRLIPKINQHSAGFVYSGQQEQRYIK